MSILRFTWPEKSFGKKSRKKQLMAGNERIELFPSTFYFFDLNEIKIIIMQGRNKKGTKTEYPDTQTDDDVAFSQWTKNKTKN